MKLNKIFSYIIVVFLFLSLIAISKNLFTPYLWFDEAGQFFISKGLNHYSNPFSNENGLIQVIENNKHYNLDPGGFGILLHFWSKFSNYHIWLRLLPFIFFLGVVVSFIYLSYSWVKKINIALLMGFIPILIPWVMSMGFEIRAYSMESLGTILCIVGLEKLKNNISYKYLLIWGCVFAFFMTSRYSEIIVVFVVSIYVIFLILKSNSSLKQKLASLIIYSLPIIATLIFIYAFAFIYQNKNIEPISYLPYLSSNKSILIQPFNLLFLLVIGLLIILFLKRNRYSIIKKYEILLVVTISINVLFILLSFLGKHPWTAYSTRCISLFLLVVLCVSAFFGELLKPLFLSSKILKYYFMISVLVTTSLLIYILYLKKEPLFVRLQDRNNTYENIEKNNLTNYNHIYAEFREYPCIRYLYEYGALSPKKKGIYPDKFTFEAFKGHEPKMNELLGYDLLITPTLFRSGNNNKWRLIRGTTNFYIQK